MDIDLKKLKQVIIVARLGSVSAAAAEMHITQPALSRNISYIEQRYGVKIFERGRHGAALTPTGEIIIREAEELLRRAETFQHNIKGYGAGTSEVSP